MAKVPAYPMEFRLRAVQLYRSSGLSIEKVAQEVGVSPTTLGNWARQAAMDSGQRPGVTSVEHSEVVALRKEIRRLEMENEILKKAAAFFARENVLPK